MKASIQLKRVPREYKKGFVKFGILHLFLIIIIAVVSGFLMGVTAFDNGYKDMLAAKNIEDGQFTTFEKLDLSIKSEMEDRYKLKIYEQFYYDSYSVDEGQEDRLYRIFIGRDEVNVPTVVKGRLPKTDRDIAINFTFAEHNNIYIGDYINLTDNIKFMVCGYIALPDYNALYRNSSDVNVQNDSFSPSLVSEAGFTKFNPDKVDYQYVWKHVGINLFESDKKMINKAFQSDLQTKVLESKNVVYDFLPASLNRSISSADGFALQYNNFILVFNYLVVGVIAFVFGITTVSHLNEEAKTIGTLRASGYSKASIVLINLILPTFVTLFSALIGNILGFYVFGQYFSQFFASMFSMPPVVVTFIPKYLVLTTVIPTAIMLLVNFLLIVYKMSIPTLKFLRGDMTRKQQKKAVKLPDNMSFQNRFRARIILQNIPNYIVIIIGILLGTILFSFGTVYKASVDNQLTLVETTQISENQYILNIPYPTENEEAEQFTSYALSYEKPHFLEASITCYGLVDNSKFVNLDFSNHDPDETDEEGNIVKHYSRDVYMSSAFQKKYRTKVGEYIDFKDAIKDEVVTLKITGVLDYTLSPSLFMSQGMLNEIAIGVDVNELFNYAKEHADEFDIEIPEDFDANKYDYFNGYFCDGIIDDLPDQVLSTVITKDNMRTEAKRIADTGTGIAVLVIIIGVGIDVLLMFLLTKQILEKNQNSISMCKILGFNDKEVAKLYIVATTLVVFVGLLVSTPLIYLFNKIMFDLVCYPTSVTFIDMVVPWYIYLSCVAAGLFAYAITTVIQMKHIKKISMVQALKEQ